MNLLRWLASQFETDRARIQREAAARRNEEIVAFRRRLDHQQRERIRKAS